ncbi:hypothetical protein [Vagococcus bubulae]|uniref:Lantibiotic ABC transporter permease n=1 Tax=Vagococcus bubulae TaxID=1977868 RepID=A0A429ZR58_9ENTE|nr:hypothetical protein [Vagococcus bubulae]RST96176.1 hypothetical protein CBF36_00135 [Vagococcus bubulae]
MIKSYWIRSKRTPVRVLMILAPILYSVIICVFFSVSKTLKGQEVLSFFAMLSIIASFSLSVLVPMVYDSDKLASFYANDLRIGINRRRLFLTRFVLIKLICVVVVLIAVSLLAIFLLVTDKLFHRTEFILLTITLLITLMPMIVVYQYVSLRFSYSGSVIMGCLTTLAAILLGTTHLGDNICQFLPFTWPIKLTFDVGKEMIPFHVLSLFWMGSVLITSILLYLLSLWYNNWDGVTRLEE